MCVCGGGGGSEGGWPQTTKTKLTTNTSGYMDRLSTCNWRLKIEGGNNLYGFFCVYINKEQFNVIKKAVKHFGHCTAIKFLKIYSVERLF